VTTTADPLAASVDPRESERSRIETIHDDDHRRAVTMGGAVP
jgi:hypothetical protein